MKRFMIAVSTTYTKMSSHEKVGIIIISRMCAKMYSYYKVAIIIV